jgi:hypothetical protein
MEKYTWTQLNEMNVDSLRRLVVDLAKENPEFVGLSKKQKPFLIQALWNYFMSTGQSSFEDAFDENTDDMFSEIANDDFDDFCDPEPELDIDDDWSDVSDNTKDAKGHYIPPDSRDKSKRIDDGGIKHMMFNGMISQGVNATNITVTVSCGSISDHYPVVGKTIYEVEKMMGQVLNVNPYARIVMVNGEEVTGDYVIKENDVVEFVNEAYDKG